MIGQLICKVFRFVLGRIDYFNSCSDINVVIHWVMQFFSCKWTTKYIINDWNAQLWTKNDPQRGTSKTCKTARKNMFFFVLENEKQYRCIIQLEDVNDILPADVLNYKGAISITTVLLIEMELFSQQFTYMFTFIFFLFHYSLRYLMTSFTLASFRFSAFFVYYNVERIMRNDIGIVSLHTRIVLVF